MALAVVTAAAIPSGWIALKHVPAQGEQKGYWILVKEPADGIAAWWSDEELAKIAAGDPEHVKHLETDWNPSEHPVAEADEAVRLAEELAKYWGGDVPQANFWAHGAMTRRGSTLRAFRWEQDGLTQRDALEKAGERPSIPAAAIDPDPVDQRYDNNKDVVAYGERWGDHLRSGTLDHVYRAELNKAKRRHHPNPPSAGEVEQKTRQTVAACRQASLKAEMGVFENYFRAWGGLAPKSVTFGLPDDCVADPGPPVAVNRVPSPTLYTACDGSKHITRRAAAAVNCDPVLYTACDGSRHASRAAAAAVNCEQQPPPRQDPLRYTACDGSKHATRRAANAVNCEPVLYTDCKGNQHSSQAAANAVSCEQEPPPRRDPLRYTACDGSRHATRRAANAVSCAPVFYTDCKGNQHASRSAANAVSCEQEPPPRRDPVRYTACDGSKHATRRAANAVNCEPPPSNKPTPDRNGGGNSGGSGGGGGNGGRGGGNGGGSTPSTYKACDDSMHSTQAAADAVSCGSSRQPQEYIACDKSRHQTQSAADAVSCEQKKTQAPADDPTYTACDGTTHYSQEDADAIPCYGEETDNELDEAYCQFSFEANCDGF